MVDLEIQREGNKPWGLRIVGGADVATVMKVNNLPVQNEKKTPQTSNLACSNLAWAIALQVEKVLGIDTPAYKAGLKAGDVLVEVQGELITMMTHPQVNIF